MGRRTPQLLSKPLEKLIIICGYCENQSDVDEIICQDSITCKSCHAPLNDEITQKRNKVEKVTEIPSLYGDWDSSIHYCLDPKKPGEFMKVNKVTRPGKPAKEFQIASLAKAFEKMIKAYY